MNHVYSLSGKFPFAYEAINIAVTGKSTDVREVDWTLLPNHVSPEGTSSFT